MFFLSFCLFSFRQHQLLCVPRNIHFQYVRTSESWILRYFSLPPLGKSWVYVKILSSDINVTVHQNTRHEKPAVNFALSFGGRRRSDTPLTYSFSRIRFWNIQVRPFLTDAFSINSSASDWFLNEWKRKEIPSKNRYQLPRITKHNLCMDDSRSS